MRTLRRLSICFIALVLLIGLVGPWIIYEVALSNIDTMPAPPDTILVSDAEKEIVWGQFRENDPIIVQPLSPYSYMYYLFMDQSSPPGARLASYVARVYIHDHLKNKQTICGHFSGAALVIWLTKNWSSDQLLQEANKTLSKS